MTAETKTCPKDIYDHLYSSKVDLLKHSENIVGLKMVWYETVVSSHLDRESNRWFNVRRLTDGDRPNILKLGFLTLGKTWPNEEIDGLGEKLCLRGYWPGHEFEKMSRIQQDIPLRQRTFGLVDEKDQKIEVAINSWTPQNKGLRMENLLKVNRTNWGPAYRDLTWYWTIIKKSNVLKSPSE